MNYTFRDVVMIYNYSIRNFCKREITFWDYEVCNFGDSKFAYICTLAYESRDIDWPLRSVCYDDDYKAPALGTMNYPKGDSLRDIAKRR